MTLRTVLTYEDYAALPADRRRYDIHDGELPVTPAPGTRHQEVKANLFDLLRHHLKDRGLGKLFDAPTDCIFTDTTIVQPDIVFVETAPLPILGGHLKTGQSWTGQNRPVGRRSQAGVLYRVRC